MATGKAPQRGSWTFIIVIFVAVLIDAVGLAQVHANYVHDHGYDIARTTSGGREVCPAALTPQKVNHLI